MEVNVQRISGNWDLGYTLDKHMLHSTHIGDDEYGYPRFDNVRTEVGEALYQLKYRNGFGNVKLLGEQMHASFAALFPTASFVVPMPPSKTRARQPVGELAADLATRLGIPLLPNFLTKTTVTAQMKDIQDRTEKVNALKAAFTVEDSLSTGVFDVLIVDDLFDTGSSLEAATHVLKSHSKVRNVFATVVTRKRDA